MTTYRSTGMLHPPHGLHGHTLVISTPGDPGAPPLIPPTPHIWRCLNCHQTTNTPPTLTATWCPDTHRALTPTTPEHSQH